MFLGVEFAVVVYDLAPNVEKMIFNIIMSIIITIVAVIIIRVFDVIIDHWGKKLSAKTKSDFDDAILPLFHRFSKAVIAILALLYILEFWGVEITPLLASLGIGGLAIAFALQKVLANIFGGISMILDKSVRVGDVISIDKGAIIGTVLDVGLRSTKIKTWDNEVVIIPNGDLSESIIQNLVLPDPSARVLITFGVEYGSNVDKVKKIALSTLEGVEGVLKDPEPGCKFMNMADFALEFRLQFHVESYTIRAEKKELVTCKLYNALNKAKIGIPFPTRTIYTKKG